jgi:hypothetical protein
LTLKVRIWPFLTTFAQLSERLKNFLRGWLLVLGLKESLVECATVCVKSVVILCSSRKRSDAIEINYSLGYK